MKTITLAALLECKVFVSGANVKVSNFEFFGIKPIEVDEATREEVLFDLNVKREESGEDSIEMNWYEDANGEEVEVITHSIGDRNFSVIGESVFEDVDA